MDFEKFQKHIERQIEEQNRSALKQFEGYSPLEMQQIYYDPFGPESPVKLQNLSEADYQKVPMLCMVLYILNVIKDKGELKLTKLGFLPTKLVADVYQQGFVKDVEIEEGLRKLYKETDAQSINLCRNLVELSGIVKKRHGKMSLTVNGAKLLQDKHALLHLIITTFIHKFNWAYYDGYEENFVGQFGCGFSFILLSKYGDEKRQDSFYAERYFKAFPSLGSQSEPRFGSSENYDSRCYSLRTFDRFMNYFGVIDIERERHFQGPKFVRKTDLFNKLIEIHPPVS